VVDYESFRAHKVVNENPRTRVKPVHNQGGLKYPPPRSGGPERQWYRAIHDDNHDGDDDDDDDDYYYDDYGYVYMVESQTAPKFESASTTNGNLMAFSEYQKIPVMQTLTDHQLSLLCGSVPGWILTDRKWGMDPHDPL
jgi:hypothetical protein